MVGCTSIDGEDYTVYQDGYCPGANELGSGDHNSATTCAAAFCTGQSSCVAFEWSASGSPSCYASTSCTATDMAYEAGWSLVIKGCDLPTKGSCETINGKEYTKISNGGCTGLNELGDGVYADPTACESARCTGTQCSSFEIDTVRAAPYPPPPPPLPLRRLAAFWNKHVTRNAHMLTLTHCTGLWTVLCKHRLQRSQRNELLPQLGPVYVWLRHHTCPRGRMRHTRRQRLHCVAKRRVWNAKRTSYVHAHTPACLHTRTVTRAHTWTHAHTYIRTRHVHVNMHSHVRVPVQVHCEEREGQRRLCKPRGMRGGPVLRGVVQLGRVRDGDRAMLCQHHVHGHGRHGRLHWLDALCPHLHPTCCTSQREW